MLRKLLLTIGIVLTANLLVLSQSGALKGKILDKETGDPLPFANIVIERGGTQIGGSTSDFDGNYQVKPIPPGTYDVKATYTGYKPMLIQGMIISSDQIRFFDIKMKSTVETLATFEVIDYKVPLISKDKTSSGATVTAEEIQKMPNRSANAVATTVGGVFSRDGERGSIRGSRSSGTVMYIDGIRVRGSSSLPASAIEQVSVILGGTPAQYGDATGGIINVTTKGPSRQFGAGLEMESSEYLDAFGYNRVGINLNGPLITKKDENGNVVSSLLGYFIAADASYRKDGKPRAIGIYKAKDDVIQYLEDNPLRPSGLATGGTFRNGEFLRLDDLEHVDNSQNTAGMGFNISGKFDVKTTKTINLTFGGQYIFNKSRGYSYSASLLNFDKNGLYENNTWRVYGRFTQRFPTSKDSKSLIKNVYYTIQADYSKYTATSQDPDHKDNLFQYGYLGQYKTYKTPSYEFGSDTIAGLNNVWLLNSWDYDTLVEFTPFNYNPLIANYTTSYYDLFAGQTEGNYQNTNQIQLGGGLLNGQGPKSIYGLYQSPGAIQSGYGHTDNSQIGINASGAADVGNHEIKFGIQYEQRIDRGYGYAPTAFWSLMRGYTNFHILELDKDNPMPIYHDGVFMDTINYYRKYDGLSQRTFDINLREKLGLPVDGLDFIVIDSYDIDNYSIDYYDKEGNLRTINLGEDIFSVDMFSADELLNNGNSLVYYRGYDYTGKKLTTKPSFADFFNQKDENDVYTRPIGAYEPIYMAGYIQDKFAFKDLIFNIGVRFDRFDANQSILSDPYLLFPARTVNEVSSINGIAVDHPSNMGNDYIVYVDKPNNPSSILGYRNEGTWYNADGFEVQDPITLSGAEGIAPYLVDPTIERVTASSFKDYKPQFNIMPRISFSFPISDEALFFAHYDVLTQRPTSNVAISPATYWFFDNIGGTINNPNLKPSKTIDYELGFQQKLSNTSSLTFTSFYREMRDMIQVYRYTGAYPKDYTSFSNLDFGTVKGLTVTYDLRRTNNARIRASYTMQFANATGASPTTTAALVASGLPNLRTTNPVPWDRRHAINILFDYRYADGKKYNGPTITKKIKGTDQVKAIQVLKNTGISMTFNGGSGTPYTASRSIRSPITGGSNLLKGSYFGSRLPWQFRMDLKVDKDIFITWGKEKNDDSRKSYLNVYLQVLNVFDTKNVMGVYPFTGNPDDDGYLAAAEWQRQIEDQLSPQSFTELYSIYVNNPGHYSSPRRIRLGIIFNF